LLDDYSSTVGQQYEPATATLALKQETLIGRISPAIGPGAEQVYSRCIRVWKALEALGRIHQ